MRQFLITSLFSLVTASSLLAQGTISFSSATGSGVTGRVYTNMPDANHLAQGSLTPYHVALYWGVLGSTEAQLVPILDGVPTAAAGKFHLGLAITGAATAPGANAVFEIRAWTGNYASYDLALNGAMGGDPAVLYGKSALFINATGGVGMPATLPANLTGFTDSLILGVPEPSTYAIMGLGFGSLVFLKSWRRRVEIQTLLS